MPVIFSDAAIESEVRDLLDRKGVALALSRMLDNPTVETPLTIGILGGWGTGKTSLMHLLRKRLAAAKGDREDVVLWFDAWAYARQERSLWRALLLKISKGLRDASAKNPSPDLIKELDVLEESLFRSQILSEKNGVKVNWSSALPLAADLALRAATAGLSDTVAGGKDGRGPFSRFLDFFNSDDAKTAVQLIEAREKEQYVAEITALDQFRSSFVKALKAAGIGEGRRLILFVDDLDRCLPEDAVAAVEAIKLFLEVEGCIFVLGMDPAVVEIGIGERYRRSPNQPLPFKPSDYLDKVIQVPFRLPPLADAQRDRILRVLGEKDSTGAINTVKPLIQKLAPSNPRSLKRILNLVLLTQELLGEINEARKSDILKATTKMVLLQTFFREVYQHSVAPSSDGLIELEEYLFKERAEADLDQSILALIRPTENDATETAIRALFSVEPYFKSLSGDELNRLITITASSTKE